MGMPGPTELVLILFVILIVFGAGKLPSVFRSLGDGIGEFKKAVKGEDEEKTKQVEEPLSKVEKRDEEKTEN